MVRRKGEITDKRRNRTHPFQVEIDIPERGLGHRMHEMQRWCAMHDYATTGGRGGLRPSMHWGFMSAEKADAFQAAFGGTRVDRPIDPVYYRPEQPPGPRELACRQMMARIGIEIIEDAKPVPGAAMRAPSDDVSASEFENGHDDRSPGASR